jgi:MFS family permease
MHAYRDLFKVPGAAMFCAAGLVARSGGAMMAIGIVMMVSSLYRSYGLAGAVSAANTICWAAGAAALSMLVDRYGQRRVMLPAAMISAAALAVLVLLGTVQAPAWSLFIPAAISGAFGGAPGALVRARWTHAVSDSRQLHTAFSLESTLDELTFVIGPVLATYLATSVAPSAGLVAPIILGASGSLWFYSLRSTEPPPSKASGSKLKRTDDREKGPAFLLLSPGVLPVALVTMLVGTLFGALDVSVVAATEAWERKSSAGLVLAAMSVGSALGGLGYGSRHWVSPIGSRWLVGMALLAVAAGMPPFATGTAFLAVAGLIGGLAIAPTLINLNTLMQNLVPASRLTEGLTWVSTCLGMGAAMGSTIAGQLIDHFYFRIGLLAAAAAAVVGALVALVSVRTVARKVRHPADG